MRRVILVVIIPAIAIATFLVVRTPVLHHPIVLFALWRAPVGMHLPVPVAGVRPTQLRDTWGAPRPPHRVHQGIDIFAPRGTPVVSATPGIVLAVTTNDLGGRVVEIVGPGLAFHYYAHLDHWAAIRAGQSVRAGDVLGYVGDSGNAKGTPCHLHYGIYVPPHHAVNPYPFLSPLRG